MLLLIFLITMLAIHTNMMACSGASDAQTRIDPQTEDARWRIIGVG